MSNRLESASPLPLIMDPLQAMKLGQSINNAQRQTEQTIELGSAFMELIRDVAGLFAWIGRSINTAVEMRDLYALSDHQLADIGLRRNQIPQLCAQSRHGRPFDFGA